MNIEKFKATDNKESERQSTKGSNTLASKLFFYATAAMAVLTGACHNSNNSANTSKQRSAVHLNCFKSGSSLPKTISYNGNVYIDLNPHKVECSSYFEDNQYSREEVHAKVDCSLKKGKKLNLKKQVKNIDIIIEARDVNCTVK